MFCSITSDNCAGGPLYPQRDDVIDQVAVEWLPDDYKQTIKSDDPVRFENIVTAIEAVAKLAHNSAAFHEHRLAVVEAENILAQANGYALLFTCSFVCFVDGSISFLR